jgi:hypothetical protein
MRITSVALALLIALTISRAAYGQCRCPSEDKWTSDIEAREIMFKGQQQAQIENFGQSVGELSPSIACRTILIGGKPCFMKLLWKFWSENAEPSLFITSSRSFKISSFPSV